MPPRLWHIKAKRTFCATCDNCHGLAKSAQFSLTSCDASCASGISEVRRSSPFLMMASHGGRSSTVNLCSNSYTAVFLRILVAASLIHDLGWLLAKSSHLLGGSVPMPGMRMMLVRYSVSQKVLDALVSYKALELSPVFSSGTRARSTKRAAIVFVNNFYQTEQQRHIGRNRRESQRMLTRIAEIQT